jgi:hypothetical protein
MTQMIEAMSQFEIPRPILRSSAGPDDTVRCRARARSAPFPAETPSCQHFAPQGPGRNQILRR